MARRIEDSMSDMAGMTDEMRISMMLTKEIDYIEIPKGLYKKILEGFREELGKNKPVQIRHLVLVTKSELIEIAGITGAEAGVVQIRLQERGLDLGMGQDFIGRVRD